MPDIVTEKVLKKLWKTFWVIAVLPLLLFMGVVLVHQLGIKVTAPGNIRTWGIFLLVFSVAFGVAVPVYMRTSFHGRYVKENHIVISKYLVYQRNMIMICSIAIVSASLAYLFIVSSLYLYGSILTALYGIYSVLPFRIKIEKELRIYRLDG